MNGFDDETLARWAAMSCCPTDITPEPALLMMVEERDGLQEDYAAADEMAGFYRDYLREAQALTERLAAVLLDNDGDATELLEELQTCLDVALS